MTCDLLFLPPQISFLEKTVEHGSAVTTGDGTKGTENCKWSEVVQGESCLDGASSLAVMHPSDTSVSAGLPNSFALSFTASSSLRVVRGFVEVEEKEQW